MVIPILCLVTSLVIFLPIVNLNISENDMEYITEQTNKYYSVDEKVKTELEKDGKADVFIAASDNNLSVFEIIILKGKIVSVKSDDNDQKTESYLDVSSDKKSADSKASADIKDSKDFDKAKKQTEELNTNKIFNSISNAVNDSFNIIVILFCLLVLLIISTTVISVLASKKLMSLLSIISSVLLFIINITIIIVFNTIFISALNNSQSVYGSVSPTAYLSVISSFIITVLTVIMFIITIGGKDSDEYKDNVTKNSNIEEHIPITADTPHEAPIVTGPCIKCIKGLCMGLEIPIQPNEVIILGRNYKSSNLVVSSPNISRQHCSIAYNAADDTYLVTDMSQNGTYSENGEKLKKGYPQVFQNGSIIYLYNRENVFQLGNT